MSRARGGIGKHDHDIEATTENEDSKNSIHVKQRGISPALWGILAFGVFTCAVVVLTSSHLHHDDGKGYPFRRKQVQSTVKLINSAQNVTQEEVGGMKQQIVNFETSEQNLAGSRKVDESRQVPLEKLSLIKDPYPFYKVSLDDGGQPWKWPGVGWDSLTLEDKRFRTSSFKFYMHEDGVFDMSVAEKCFRDNMKIYGADDPDRPHLLDENLRLNQRQYLVELYIWPELRKHEMRTMDPEVANMFFIGYSPYLNHQSYPCAGIKKTKAWEEDVATALKSNKYWLRNGGKDHFMFYMKYNIALPKRLQTVLDSGVNVITTDRHYWSISHNLKNTFEEGRVLVIPYVCSTFMDSQFIEYHNPHAKNPKSHYMFFGNLRRRFGGRSYVLDLGDLLQGANFKGTELHREPIPNILNETAVVMRESSICLCPSGDAPTSVRVFEALGSGCVPVVLGYKDKMHTDLPYPSLIDWDAIALFTSPLETVTKREDGLQTLAKALEDTVGLHAKPEQKARLERMREEGTRVFRKHLAFRRSPRDATDSVLIEAWVLLQMHGLVQGPYSGYSKSKKTATA